MYPQGFGIHQREELFQTADCDIVQTHDRTTLSNVGGQFFIFLLVTQCPAGNNFTHSHSANVQVLEIILRIVAGLAGQLAFNCKFCEDLRERRLHLLEPEASADGKLLKFNHTFTARLVCQQQCDYNGSG